METIIIKSSINYHLNNELAELALTDKKVYNMIVKQIVEQVKLNLQLSLKDEIEKQLNQSVYNGTQIMKVGTRFKSN